MSYSGLWINAIAKMECNSGMGGGSDSARALGTLGTLWMPGDGCKVK